VTRRLFHVNAYNDLTVLEEVQSLIKDIAEAWKTLPNLLGQTQPAMRYAN
jgi:flagellar protein FliS